MFADIIIFHSAKRCIIDTLTITINYLPRLCCGVNNLHTISTNIIVSNSDTPLGGAEDTVTFNEQSKT